jgi:uncharacterized linocin/CFP29 family protein
MTVMKDYIIGNQAFGDVGAMLLENNMDPGMLRPAIDSKGRKYVRLFDGIAYNASGEMVVKTKKKFLAANAPVTVPQEAWKVIDQAVVRAAMPRLSFVNRLRSRNLTYNVPNAMGKTVLETQVMGRITPATISMDAVRRGDADQMESDVAHLPLPIIHKDAEFTLRQIAVSRNSSMPYDTTYLEMAAEEVAIEVERLFLGTSVNNGYKYAGASVWGLLNFPDRMTKPDMTAPSDVGWTPEVTYNEVIAMRVARVGSVSRSGLQPELPGCDASDSPSRYQRRFEHRNDRLHRRRWFPHDYAPRERPDRACRRRHGHPDDPVDHAGWNAAELQGHGDHRSAVPCRHRRNHRHRARRRCSFVVSNRVFPRNNKRESRDSRFSYFRLNHPNKELQHGENRQTEDTPGIRTRSHPA